MDKDEKNKIEIKAYTPLMIKEGAELVYNRLGMNMNDAINMFLKETVVQNDIPFEIHSTHREELLEAIEESNQIIEDIRTGKRQPYHNLNKLFEDLDNDI